MLDSEFYLVTVSIVSHGQGVLVAKLLVDIARCPHVSEIILTQNIPEPEIVCPSSLQSRVRFIHNSQPLGFAANHNQAFQVSRNSFFAVLNPDIRFEGNPFFRLLGTMTESDAALIAPVIRNSNGEIEDSIRHFPTLSGLVGKAIGLSTGQIYFDDSSSPFCPEWVGGMFMLFRSEAYAALGGFDDRFFLYYEDVDICVRAWRAGMRIVVCPAVSVVHDAQRDSHRKLRHLAWHLMSMARYFMKHSGRLPQIDVVLPK